MSDDVPHCDLIYAMIAHVVPHCIGLVCRSVNFTRRDQNNAVTLRLQALKYLGFRYIPRSSP